MNDNVTPVDAAKTDGTAESAVKAGADGEPHLPPWLQQQLARVYSSIVEEPLPPDLMELVRRLESGSPEPGRSPRDDG